jgi:hypothetical protein
MSVEAEVTIPLARVLAPHEHSLLKAHDVSLAWERHKMYWLGFDDEDNVHALVETASATGPQLLNAAGFCAATAQQYTEPVLQQQYVRWLTQYLQDHGVAGLLQSSAYLTWQGQQAQAYSSSRSSSSSSPSSKRCPGEGSDATLPATHGVSNLSAVFHNALSIGHDTDADWFNMALPNCTLVEASCNDGLPAHGPFQEVMRLGCTVHTYLHELPAVAIQQVEKHWASMPAALRPIPNDTIPSACNDFVGQLLLQARRVGGTACDPQFVAPSGRDQAGKLNTKSMQVAPRAELMLATQPHEMFPTNLRKDICQACSLHTFGQSPDGSWWEEAVQCVKGRPGCTGQRVYKVSSARGSNRGPTQPGISAVQQLSMSAKAWAALHHNASTAAQDLLASLTGCKQLITYRTDMERLYAILWAGYADLVFQLPTWLLNLTALVLVLGLFVQHGFVVPVLMVLMVERVWGTVAWVTRWLRLAFIACTSTTDPVTSGCVRQCMFSALQLLGSSTFGFVFRYLPAPSSHGIDGQIDAVSSVHALSLVFDEAFAPVSSSRLKLYECSHSQQAMLVF